MKREFINKHFPTRLINIEKLHWCILLKEKEEETLTWSIISSKGLFGRFNERIIASKLDLRSEAASYLIVDTEMQLQVKCTELNSRL